MKKTETDDPLVSILIASYCAEDFIQNTIQNILQQSYTHRELLIIDDDSHDNTWCILETCAKIDHRIKIFQNTKNIWPYISLNRVLDHAQWVYIAIQDHDDLRHPQKLEKQIAFLERHHDYVWCGTKTLMRYESDKKGFEYFLWKNNYYTIHPSLVFRNNKNYRYPTDSVYMNDALFQKIVLCRGWEKLIANINETLTLHVIKDGARNFSYKRFRYTRSTCKTIFTLHPIWYSVFIIWWETIRKIVYPLLKILWKGRRIDPIERLPFRLLGNNISEYPFEKARDMWF